MARAGLSGGSQTGGVDLEIGSDEYFDLTGRSAHPVARLSDRFMLATILIISRMLARMDASRHRTAPGSEYATIGISSKAIKLVI